MRKKNMQIYIMSFNTRQQFGKMKACSSNITMVLYSCL